MFRFRLLVVSVLFSLCACNCTEGGKNGPEDPDVTVDGTKDVTAYVTTADMKNLFRKSSFDFSDLNVLNVRYDKTALGKEIDGFGLAVTTATCYNLMKMVPEDRTAFLKEMFSPTEGIGSNLIRVSIGASDFCLHEEYTWCDKPGLENFAVHKEDKDYLFPILKEICEDNSISMVMP